MGLSLDTYVYYICAMGRQYVGQVVRLERGPSLTLIGMLSAQGLGALQLLERALGVVQ